MVMHYKGALSTVDPNKVKIGIPQIDLPPLDSGQPTEELIAADVWQKITPLRGVCLTINYVLLWRIMNESRSSIRRPGTTHRRGACKRSSSHTPS